jgi:hypothetical protein
MTVTQHIYATPAQYYAYIGETDPNGEQDTDPETLALLARASQRIDRLLLTAIYFVDYDTGMPTDEFQIDVIMRATCAQAQFFDETGDINGAGSQFQSGGLGSASFTRAGASAGATISDPRTSAEAVDILINGGLIPQGPRY